MLIQTQQPMPPWRIMLAVCCQMLLIVTHYLFLETAAHPVFAKLLLAWRFEPAIHELTVPLFATCCSSPTCCNADMVSADCFSRS